MKKINLDNVYDFELLVSELTDVLKQGGLVVVPTDTCYGILADANNLDCLEKVRVLRALPETEYLPLLICDSVKLLSLLSLDDTTTQLIEEYLPGPLTVIAEGVGKYEGHFIGVRYPEHNLLTEIYKNFKGDLILTAAAKFGMTPVYDVEQLSQQYDSLNDIEIIVDAGTLDLIRLSTVVKSEDNQIEILREGKLTSLLVSQFSHKQV